MKITKKNYLKDNLNTDTKPQPKPVSSHAKVQDSTPNRHVRGKSCKKNRQVWPNLFKNLPDAYIFINFNGHVIDVNNAALKLLGYEKFIPFNATHHIHKQDIYLAKIFLDTIQKNGFYKDFEIRLVTTTQNIKWIHLNANILYSECNNPVGIQAVLRDVTHYKTTYEKAKKKENELNIILNNAPLGILLTDRNNIIESNKKIEELLGYGKAELMGKNMLTLTAKKDIQKSQVLINQLESGKINFFQLEKRYIRKDGTILWAKTRVNAYRNKHGKQEFDIILIEDLTEKTQQQQLLSQQKRELDLILENSPSAIGLTENNYFIKCNQTLKTLLGYTEIEKRNCSILNLVDKNDIATLQSHIDSLNSGKTHKFHIEIQLTKKDSEKIWTRIKASSVKNTISDSRYIVYIIENITQQRKKQLVENIVTNTTLSVANNFNIHEITHRLSNSISQYLNSNYCSISLINNKTGQAEKIVPPIHPLHNQKYIVKNPILTERTIQTKTAQIIDDTSKIALYNPKTNIGISEIIVPILYNNQVIGIINAQHKQKNHFTKTHLKILIKIAETVAPKFKNAIQYKETLLVQKKNQELVKKLKQNNDELKDFAHVVSHDLKSPLRSIDTLIHWLKEDFNSFYKTNENADRLFSNLDTKLEHMENLIDGILKYSSVGIISNTKKTKINLNFTIKNIIDLVHIPKHITIKIINPLPTITGCEIRIHQLFLNLINNAVKYNDKDVGFIEIDHKNLGNYWEFRIKDNGKGIPEKYLEKIFEIFQTLEDNTNSTGIGLSIVRKIVSLYDGKIWVTSKIGQGSTFYFTIKQ
ncbi:MAG: PAS domain S-box protein [Aestuariibaculum sp.]